MADAGRNLYKHDMELLLDTLNNELKNLTEKMELLFCGGVLFVLDGDREYTRDIDGKFIPSNRLNYFREKISEVMEIEKDWINLDVNHVFGLYRLPRTEYVHFRTYSNMEI